MPARSIGPPRSPGRCCLRTPRRRAGSARLVHVQLRPAWVRATTSAERTLRKDNVARLEEKWRFPPKDSEEQVGVIHGTPVVVDGFVYVGTATVSAVYKLAPDGKLKWGLPEPGPAQAIGPSQRQCRRAEPTAS